MENANDNTSIRMLRLLLFHAASLGAIVISTTLVAYYSFLAIFPIAPSGDVGQMNKVIYSTVAVVSLVIILYWITVWFCSNSDNQYGFRSFFRS